MGIESIGNIISKLRKEKGATQEELAKYTQVSTQAVSKWENGGVPDTDLLPKIADFFGVSIDTLFGRNITEYSDIENALAKKIAETKYEEQFEAAFELCWVMQKRTCEGQTIKEIQNDLGDQKQFYSTIFDDNGFTLMGLSKRLPYYLLVPECKNKELAFFEGIDYITFFKDFSDKNVFDAMILLNKRENKGFTPNLLIKKLNVDFEKAIEIIKTLQKYKLIKTTQIEMDDALQEIYTYDATPSFVAFLIFAREMIDRPGSWNYYCGGRNKPYLL